MSYGIQVASASGMLVDGTMPNLVYAGTVTATRINPTSQSNAGSAINIPPYSHKTTLIASATMPIVALNPQEQTYASYADVFYNYGQAIEAIIEETAGQWRIYLTCGINVGNFAVDVFINVGNLTPGDAFGTQVFSAGGSKVFDSGAKPVKWKGYAQFTMPGLFQGPGGFLIPDAITYPRAGNRIFFTAGCMGASTFNLRLVEENIQFVPMVVKYSTASYLISWFARCVCNWDLATAYSILTTASPSLYWTPTSMQRIIHFLDV